MTRHALYLWPDQRPAGLRANGFSQLFDTFGQFLEADQERLWTSSPSESHETETAFQFSFDMPGLKKEDIDITVENNGLWIKGERKKIASESENTNVERRERHYKHWLKLPNTADTESIAAAYEDGVLTLSVHKKASAKPRKVEVLASTN